MADTQRHPLMLHLKTGLLEGVEQMAGSAQFCTAPFTRFTPFSQTNGFQLLLLLLMPGVHHTSIINS